MHYHGTPITPRAELLRLAGRHFCVSYARPEDVRVCHEIGQSVLLDNGAFTFWRQGRATDWPGYYDWCDKWLCFPTTWAVITDVIDGYVEQNRSLLDAWPFPGRGAPVWHLAAPIDYLGYLTDSFDRVCFGSSGPFAAIGTSAWHGRVTEAWNYLGRRHQRTPWVHMLRGMSLSGSIYPFSSVDSTDIARNHNRPQNSVVKLAERWDAKQCPGRWMPRAEQMDLIA